MAESQKDTAIKQWLSGEISLDQLKQQIPEEEALKYAQIIEEVDQWTPEIEALSPPDIQAKASKEAKVISIHRSTWLSVAASLLIISLATFWFLFSSSETTYYAENEVIAAQFPDQVSSVQLNACSSISWDEDDWESDFRYSRFSGTGFFEVEKGGEFKVTLNEGTVTVLGTSFEIDTYDDGFSVSCYTGEVSVAGNDGNVRRLKAGRRVSFHGNKLRELQNFKADDKPSWLSNGTSSFDDAPLAQVISRLEREFEVKFNTTAIHMDRRFTGSFKHDDLDKALKIVFTALNITYEKQDNLIVLKDS